MRGQRGAYFLNASVLTDIEGNLEVQMKVRGSALRRSRTNRMIAGVCGGLQDFFGLDAFWFRLGFVLAMIPAGIPGIAIYLVMWLVMPSE
jgi:phage shock protein PspC (stress-responsive transcriptional regulator)